MVWFSLFSSLFLLCCFVDCYTLNRTVLTPNGPLRGYTMTTRNGRTILAFSGVPYAKPPVGKLRFTDPEPVEKWRGVRNAQNFGPICPQHLAFIYALSNVSLGQEDCLYISIYTPFTHKKLPVLVNFHGGAFFTGFGEISHSPAYLLDEDIVVVTGNYRLGALGFLSFGDDLVSGNYGLKDQNMILKWVRRNIASFGGDPFDVTIGGESAGGASVHYHLLSPLSRGYFQKAIAMSGSALCPWAYVSPHLAQKRALKLAEHLGCTTKSSSETLDCLRTKDAYEIMNVKKKFYVWGQLDPLTSFVPTIDGQVDNAFLPGDPWEMPTAPVPLVMGVSRTDGYLKTGSFVRTPLDYRTFDKHFDALAAVSLFHLRTASNPSRISKQIRKFYFENQPIRETNILRLTDMYTDSWFFFPVISTVRNHTGKIYLYMTDYEGENSFAETFGGRRIFKGSTHTDELIYIWNVNAIFPPLRGRDVTFSRILVKLLANFMKSSDPTSEGLSFGWVPWDQDESYLNLGKIIRLENKLFSKREKFWSTLKFRDLQNQNLKHND